MAWQQHKKAQKESIEQPPSKERKEYHDAPTVSWLPVLF
jgi:hypothetical protein